MTDTPVRAVDEAQSGPALLRLARRDRGAAERALRSLPIDARVDRILDLRPEARLELLALVDHPEEIVARLPDAELCVTARATGMSEAPWLLGMATPDQLRACFDLDCWQGGELDRGRVTEWLSAAVEAGPETLLSVIESADPEVLVLALRGLTGVAILDREESPPEGWVSVDGVVFFGPHEGTDPALVRAVALTTFARARERYWQLVYGLLFELEAECEEYALRWRTGRLADLGFPEIEQASEVYRSLKPGEVVVWEAGLPDSAVAEVRRVPRQISGTLLEEGLAKLPPRRAADLLGYVLSVANAIAVADRLPLSESESAPRALEKAVRGIERGLRELCQLRNDPPERVLDTTRPLDLFRLGVTASPDLRRSRGPGRVPLKPTTPADRDR